jgi:hypothetical protein
MTNPIGKRIARIEARLDCKNQAAEQQIIWVNTPADAERRQRENPGAMIIHWEFGTEQRL